MKLHKDIDRLPEFNKAVLTIGTFDGVHLGHQKIISQLKSEAARIGGETVIITFDPHPRKIVQSAKDIRLITTIDERIELLSAAGIDHLVIVPFTKGFSELEPRDYVQVFLEKCNPSIVIIGYDHKFGRERRGDYKLLEEFASQGYFELREIPGHIIKENTVSSTLIRNAIADGDIEKANELLGYDFTFEGEVVKGDQLGRQLGYPTANIKVLDDEKIVPGDGIYAVRAEHKNAPQRSLFDGMMSIGVRPTVNGTKRTIEVNLFEFNEDVYGQVLRVHVKAYIRPEKKFSGLDELKAAIQNDEIAAKKILQ